MRNLWKDSGLTIILLPSGEQGDKLYQVAKLWTELRMLSAAIWIRHELLESSTSVPPKQNALVLGAEQGGQVSEIQVDLFEQLARQPLNRVRLLVVRTALPDLDFDKKQDSLVDLISDYLDWSLPASVNSANASEKLVDFVKLNLITSPTEHQLVSSTEYRQPRFNAHFIAASEDRATPASGDAFVRNEPDSSKFAGFTMLHVSTLGGLWVGLPQGTYEMVKPGVWHGDKAFVSRVFISSILTDGLARRASTRVLERAGNPQNGFVDLTSEVPIEGTYPISDDQLESWLDWMVSRVFEFDNGIVGFRTPEAIGVTEQRRITIGRQLSEFWKFGIDKLLRAPYFGVLWIYRGIVRFINGIFQGGSEGASIIPEPEERMDKRDQLVLDALKEVSRVKGDADAALVSPVSPSRIKSTPELWSSIRKLVFGVLDGSNLDQLGVKKSENGWPVFYRVSSIFKDPAEIPKILDLATLELRPHSDSFWESPDELEKLASDYATKKKSLEVENREKLEALVAKRAALQGLEEKISAYQARIDAIEPDKDATVDEKSPNDGNANVSETSEVTV